MVFSLATIVSAHIGSPDVFFTGKAGPHDISVVVRPPEVVPGVARVTVKAPDSFEGRVLIRPVYWRAGSKGAPSADAMLRVNGSDTFEGSLWLMSRGAYSVEVIVEGRLATGRVLVPVASIATGRLALNTPLAAVLIVLGLFLVTGLVNIVRKAAGESLLDAGRSLNEGGVRTSRIAGAVAVVVLVLVIFGGARWWNSVDKDYERTIYRPSPLKVVLLDGVLRVAATDTLYLPAGRASTYVPDHGKLMHLFLVNERAFAHLHPRPDSAEVPEFTTPLPPLPAGTYRIYADVVQETGFERTMVGALQIPGKLPTTQAKLDPDDGWFTGDVSASNTMRLADGSTMSLTPGAGKLVAGEGLTLGVTVNDAAGKPLSVEPYLGMAAHAVVVRDDGAVYIHLHPTGTVTAAAQDVFQARERGDTTATGRLNMLGHNMSAMSGAASATSAPSAIAFPYSFPKPGDYRVYVQVKRGGKVLTGAFAITVAAPAPAK